MNLLSLLREAAHKSPDRGVVHVRSDGSETFCSHAALWVQAARACGGYRAALGGPGGQVLLPLERSESFLPAFWGAVMAGLIPVPLAVERERLLSVWRFLGAPSVVVDAPLRGRIEGWLEPEPAAAMRLLSLEELLGAEPDLDMHEAAPEDLAYLQFSSGSTGSPRGVELTHANLLANVEQMREALDARSDDVLVTWMPYFHDMGLVGTHLLPLALGMKQVKLEPLHFARRPRSWLEAAHRHRATLLSAANFALSLVVERLTPGKVAGLDLCSVRVLANGAEPISPRVCRAFLELLAPCSLAPEAMLPVYGLAEASLAVSFPPPGEGLRTLHVQRDTLARQRRAIPTSAGAGALEITQVGRALPGCELRIVGARGRVLGEGRVGEIRVRGPNVARGYHRQPAETHATFRDGWLATGDLGFLLDGRLHVTGRRKDILFVNGRNHHASDLEEAIARLPGVLPGCVAAAGHHDGEAGGERVAIFLSTRPADLERAAPLLREVRARARELLGIAGVELVPIAAREFPRTTSGKLQRYRLRERLEAGEFAETVARLRRLLDVEGAGVQPPRDPLATTIHGIWSRVLGRDPGSFGVDEPFRRLGGSSLQAMEVLTSLEAALGRPLEPALLAECATVAELARRLRAGAASVAPASSDSVQRSATSTAGAQADARQAPPAREEVAVIAIACRFPGADTPEAFWENLAAGVDSITEIPDDRRALHEVSGPVRHEPGAGAWRGGFLREVAAFDAEFFRFEPSEADAADPQQRLLLEVAYEALERAGYAGPRREGRRVGVFVAVGESSYQEQLLAALAEGRPLHPAAVVGNLRNMIAARLAHFLDLTGPVLAVDTACSSSLVALHLGRESLLRGECDLAVVGGVSLNLTPTPYRLLDAAGALSPTGGCRAFSERADGMVPGEGAGALVLARLADACAAGDPLLGVVKGSAVNNDGRGLGPMAPNPVLQQAVIEQAYRDARLDPASVSYLEAHGSATPIGDPIEARSLARVFPPPAEGSRRALGSVKTNVGHLLNAAGIPALIKVLLAFERRQLPASLHADPPSTRFDLGAAGFEVVRETRPWTGPRPLRAGINGFGFGGTNAHVILEEPPSRLPPAGAASPAMAERAAHLLTLSARTDTALRASAADLARYLRAHPEVPEADLCFGASTARDALERRVALVAAGDLAEQLEAMAAGRGPHRAAAAGGPRLRPRIAFLFSGQGTQTPGQGRELYEREPRFRALLEEATALVPPVRGRTLPEWCYGEGVGEEDLARPAVAQPLLVCFQVALARLVQEWGIVPEAVVGHSLGEIAAACVAGSLDLADAVRLATERARQVEALCEPGVMAAALAPEAAVREALAASGEAAWIAAVNAPEQVTLSGCAEAVGAVLATLAQRGYRSLPMRVSHAFHSPLVEPAAAGLRPLLERMRFAPCAIPFLSTVDGDWRQGGRTFEAGYWQENLLRPVRFSDAVRRLLDEGFDTFVEIGPGRQLSSLVRRLSGRERAAVTTLSLLNGGRGDERALLEALGRLWARGAPLDRLQLEVGRPRRRLVLPTYPFERTRHWLDPADPAADELPPEHPHVERRDGTRGGAAVAPSAYPPPEHPLLAECRALRLDHAELVAEIAADDPLLREHQVHGTHLLPGAGTLELVLAAAEYALARPVAGVAATTFLAPVRAAGAAATRVAITLRRESGRLAFELCAEGGELLATGELLDAEPSLPEAVDLSGLRARCPCVVGPADFYADLAGRGMVHGGYFQGLASLRLGADEALAEICLPAAAPDRSFRLHPALLDAAIQPVAALLRESGAAAEAALYIPFAIEELSVHTPLPGACVTHVRLPRPDAATPEVVRCDLDIYDTAGRPAASLRGLSLKRIGRHDLLAVDGEASDPGELLHHPVWVEDPPGLPTSVGRPKHLRIVPDATGEIAAVVMQALRARGHSCELLPGDSSLPAAVSGGDAILFLRGCGPISPLRSVEALDAAIHGEVLTLAELARAVALLPRPQRPARLLVATSGAHWTGPGDAPPAPHRAMLSALALALGDEIAGMTSRVLDFAASEPPEFLAAALAREIEEESASGLTAWREERRLVRRLERGAPPLATWRAVALRPGGVYVITGGGSGIGAEVARRIATRAPGAVLVLVGRTSLQEAPARRLLLDELRSRGAVAEYVAADVAAEAGVAAVLDQVIERYGGLAGLVHAAGVMQLGPITAKPPERLAALMAPKARGAWLLAQALAERELAPDFVVLFSSISSILPGLGGGLSDYAGANAFLDALAVAQRLEGHPFQAIDWSAWRDAGMAARADWLPALEARGLVPLASEPAVGAFERALSSGAAQVAILAPREEATGTVSRPAADADLPDASSRTGSGSSLTRAAAAPAGEGGDGTLEELLRSLVAAAVGIPVERVRPDEPFVSLGLESLGAVELVKELEVRLGRTLPTTLFFEHPSVAELAAHLAALTAPPAPMPPPPRVAAEAKPESEDFALSPVQLAFYAQHRLYPELPAVAFLRQTLRGPLSAELLVRAIELLERRHPMLRALLAAPSGAGEPRQRIAAPRGAAGWLRIHNESSDAAAIERETFTRPFDLDAGPPFHVDLIPPAEGRSHLLLTLHHIVGDAWSLNRLTEELWWTYTRLAAGEQPDLAPLASDYRDFLHAEAEERRGVEQDTRWWRATLAGIPPLPLPRDREPGGSPPGPLCSLQFAPSAEVSAGLRGRAAAEGVSLFQLLLAAYYRCLESWSGEQDVTVNVARSRRHLRVPELERLVGSCADTLPLRCRVSPAEPAGALAARLREGWLAAEQHGSVTSLDLARLLGAGRGPALRTASPASFSFARFPIRLPASCPVSIESVAAGTGSAATRLGLAAWEIEGALCFSWNYAADLFAASTIERLAAELLDELREIALPVTSMVPGVTLAAPAASPAVLLAAPERDGAHSPPVSGVRAAPTMECVSAAIMRRCADTPEAIAVWEEDGGLSYAELRRDAERIAATLLSTCPERRPVGVLTSAGSGTVTALVGVLRAGAAWLPLDPDHPPARLADQLERAGVSVLLCDGETSGLAQRIEQLLAAPLRVIRQHELPEASAPIPEPEVDADDVAYVIFTSGSTGRPKGVPITHRSLRNYLGWALDEFGYAPGDRLAQTASIAFDASVRQILAPLLAGATIVPVRRELTRDPEALLRMVERAELTVWSSVPSLWERLLERIEARVAAGGEPPALPRLRWIHLGGERLRAEPVRRWYRLFGERVRLSNLYGPTETTINATCHILRAPPGDGEQTIPIGRPVRGATLRVVDPQGGPVAAGEAGELWVGGTGLSPGYLGDPALTQEAFVRTAEGERVYRTGDRVRLRPDAALEFLGRLDEQVKIRGHRVELGEIEAAIVRAPGVRRCAVVLANGTGPERLVAFVEAESAAPADAELRRFLRALLPDYMLPHAIHRLRALPRTTGGKVDRQRLLAAAESRDAAPDLDASGSGLASDRSVGLAEPPATPTEQLLAAEWRALLGPSALSRHDDFFEQGGDSLLALQLFARLGERVAALPRPTVIYRSSTLAALAGELDAAAAAATSGAAAGGDPLSPRDGPFPLSPAQAGFLLAETIAPGSQVSWLAGFELEGALVRDAFQQAMDHLVERHPMLRTVFPPELRPRRQVVIRPERRLEVEYLDLSTLTERQRSAAVEAAWEAARRQPFSPGLWPLLRIRLLRLGAERHLLLVAAHHLIGDGYSAHLLARELLHSYDRLVRGEAPTLPPLRTTYRDYVELLERESAGADEAAEAYWREALDGCPSPGMAPAAEGAVPPATSPATVSLDVPPEVMRRLRERATARGAGVHAVLLTAFARQLRRRLGSDDLLIGTAHSGRDHALPDITRLVGSFATALPLRVRLAEEDFGTHLERVSAGFAAARRHLLPPQRLLRLLPRGAARGVAVGARFFFTFLDFDSLGPLESETLRVQWDASRSEVELPAGTELLLAARPAASGALRLTLRASAQPAELRAFGCALVDDLRAFAASTATRIHFRNTELDPARDGRPDAALIGYLPPADELLRLAGLPAGAATADALRRMLFPDDRARWIELLETPLGRSAFLCLPRFADELEARGAGELCSEVAAAVRLAGELGARAVSLAGMLPSLTGYGFAVERALAAGQKPVLTTGHGATVVSVVRTVESVLTATGRRLEELRLAVLGLGAIGRSSLELLLDGLPHPRSLVLCDLPGSEARLELLGRELRERLGYRGDLQRVTSAPSAPPQVYQNDLILGATSGGGVLDIDRLRPGTLVVDDSFPHCFDPTRAIARMESAADVLVVGGGLLDCGAAVRTLHLPEPARALHETILEQMRLRGVASCQVESLLLARDASLPPIRGVVDLEGARRYRAALAALGVRAAPLHLRGHVIEDPLAGAGEW